MSVQNEWGQTLVVVYLRQISAPALDRATGYLLEWSLREPHLCLADKAGAIRAWIPQENVAAIIRAASPDDAAEW